MRYLSNFALFVIGCIVWFNSVACAGELFEIDTSPESKFLLHLNGYAFHFNRTDQNELNLGTGFSYVFGQVKSKKRLFRDSYLAFESDIYEDSSNDLGYAVGVSWQRPLYKSLNWGLKAGVVHQDEQADDSGMYLIPFILPFIESHWYGPLNARVTLVPPMGLTYGLLAFQLMISFN